jgi:RNA polymerase sigma-70 factor (ECF subfamily)
VTLHTEFEDLLHTYQQPLTAYLCNLLSDEEQGKELAQDTFLRAYRALARGQQVTCPKAWLYRIATNVANDHFRWARLLRWLPLHEVEQHPALCVSDSTDGVADQLIVRGPWRSCRPIIACRWCCICAKTSRRLRSPK